MLALVCSTACGREGENPKHHGIPLELPGTGVKDQTSPLLFHGTNRKKKCKKLSVCVCLLHHCCSLLPAKRVILVPKHDSCSGAEQVQLVQNHPFLIYLSSFPDKLILDASMQKLAMEKHRMTMTAQYLPLHIY